MEQWDWSNQLKHKHLHKTNNMIVSAWDTWDLQKKYKDASTAEEIYDACLYEMITFSYKRGGVGGGFSSGQSGLSYIGDIWASSVVSPIA